MDKLHRDAVELVDFMKKTAKKYFIPHAENNYLPHVLHTKRAVYYAALGLAMKIVVVGFAAVLPLEAFVLPEVLQAERGRIIALTNTVRKEQGDTVLSANEKLAVSAQHKAKDMADRQYFSHTGPDGRGITAWISQVGYPYTVAGENLAMGFSTADEVVNAWKKSPSHYANLVDSEFSDVGVGVEGGDYQGMPTVFVAQHLASPVPWTVPSQPTITVPAPKMAQRQQPRPAPSVESHPLPLPSAQSIALPPSAPSAYRPADQSGVTEKQTPGIVAGVTTYAVAVPPDPFDRAHSSISWQEQGQQTFLSVHAVVNDDVRSAVVEVHGYPIALHPTGPNLYTGHFLALEPTDNFFRVIIPPVITIVDAHGRRFQDQIVWERIKIVSPTPLEKYSRARTTLGSVTSIFRRSREIYVALILFFSAALLLNIFIEIKRQHPRIIAQTLLLIGVLALLYAF